MHHMQWERRWLAQQMKYEFTPEERADLFVSWNVHRDSRERKLQLTRQLWAPTTIRWVLLLSQADHSCGCPHLR